MRESSISPRGQPSDPGDWNSLSFKGEAECWLPWASGNPAKKTPGTKDRPGATSEFRFPNYTDFGVGVKFG